MKCLIFLVVCSAVVLAEMSEAKPQSNQEMAGARCCNKCEPCRSNFVVEKPVDPDCPRTLNYSYNVQVIEPHCPCHKFDILDANVEKPKDPPCPSKLKLTAKVEHHTRDCSCPTCWYGTFSNISLHTSNSEQYYTNKSYSSVLKEPKIYEFRSRRNSIQEENDFTYRFPRKRYKRSTLGELNCNDLVKKGYICRCVPDDGSSCFSDLADDEPIVGSSFFRETADETDVHIGGSRPPSFETIRKHMSPIALAREGRSTLEEVRGLAEIYYEIYQHQHEKNLTIPIKYGTKIAEGDAAGLRTYDIEPVEGEYKLSNMEKLAQFSNSMFGELVDTVKKMPKLPRLGIFPLRENRQKRRVQRNSRRKKET